MKLFDIDDEIESRGFDCSYSWSDMANALTDHNIPDDSDKIAYYFGVEKAGK
jgi:hypothetical protein